MYGVVITLPTCRHSCGENHETGERDCDESTLSEEDRNSPVQDPDYAWLYLFSLSEALTSFLVFLVFILFISSEGSFHSDKSYILRIGRAFSNNFGSFCIIFSFSLFVFHKFRISS